MSYLSYPCKNCLIKTCCTKSCKSYDSFVNHIDYSTFKKKSLKNNICPYCGSSISIIEPIRKIRLSWKCNCCLESDII